jgi:hypothetical protein
MDFSTLLNLHQHYITIITNNGEENTGIITSHVLNEKMREVKEITLLCEKKIIKIQCNEITKVIKGTPYIHSN